MRYQIRYQPHTDLGQRFPSVEYPWRGPGFDSREDAERLMDACPNAAKMEIVEVPDARS